MDRPGVAIVGAGPAGLVIAHLLLREAIPFVVFERQALAELARRPKAGLVEYRTVRGLTHEGIAGRVVRFTTENHRCEFRTPDESVLLEYAALTGGRPHYIYPQHELVERLCEALTAAGGEIRFGHAVRAVTQDSSAHALGLPDSLIDFTADTTRAIAQLQYGNTFARTPDVTFVFSHAGGTVPYLAGRFGIVDEMRVIPGAEARATAAETFRRLYWDTALSWSDQVLRMLRDIAGIDRVLFGSDYPYLRRDLAVSSRRHIEANPELTTSERTAILGGTAAKLIPRLASLRSRTQRQAS